MASTARVDELRKTAVGIVTIPIDDTVAKQEWGAINFDLARGALSVVYQIANELLELPIDQLPENAANEIQSVLASVHATIAQIRAFTIETGNPRQVRDQLLNQLNAQRDQLYVVAHSWIPYLAYQRGDIQRQLATLRETVEGAERELTTARETIGERRGEIDAIVSAAREAAAEAGVATFASDFHNQAAEHDREAKTWLRWTGGLLTATVFVALVFMWKGSIGDTPAQVIHYTTTKIVVLAMFITASAWSAGLYRSAKLQAATNRFKANALKTFQAFSKAADDPITRDAVLVETTRAIFAPPPTGLSGAESAVGSPPTKIIEMIKGSSE